MTDEKQHSPIGASICERWWNCPASVKMSEGIPNKTSKYAAQGTVAHAVAERVLLKLFTEENPRKSYRILLNDEEGRSYIQDGFDIEVDEAMTDAVEVYILAILDELDKFGLTMGSCIKVEKTFHLKHLDDEAYGSCDTMIVSPFTLHAFDYKHGAGHAVEVINNKQLLYYLLGAYYEVPADVRIDLHYLELVIVQPRATHLHGPVRRFRISIADLLFFEAELRQAIGRVRSPNPIVQAGSWCQWCPAKPVCHTHRSHIFDETGVNLMAAEKGPLQLPNKTDLDPVSLRRIFENAKLLNEWVSSVVAMCTAIAADGKGEVQGYKSVTKYGRRTWVDEHLVENQFILEFGDSIFTKKLRSPSQMEKLLGKTRKHEIEGLYDKPITGTVLVPDSDPRPEVPTGIAAQFDDVSHVNIGEKKPWEKP